MLGRQSLQFVDVSKRPRAHDILVVEAKHGQTPPPCHVAPESRRQKHSKQGSPHMRFAFLPKTDRFHYDAKTVVA